MKNHYVSFADVPSGTTFTSNSQNQVAVIGQSVKFTCKAVGLPEPHYSIMKSGKLVSNLTNTRYIITALTKADGGEYTCIPFNYLGPGPKKSINLTLIGMFRYLIHTCKAETMCLKCTVCDERR